MNTQSAHFRLKSCRSKSGRSKSCPTSALVLLASLLLSSLAGSISAQATTNLKVAVVDLEALFFSVAEGEALRTQLGELEKTTKGQIEAIGKRMEEMSQGLATKTPQEQREIARRREDEERDARRISDAAQRQAAKLEQAARDKFNQRLEPVLRKFQEDQGLDLILNKTPGVVIFASEAADVSIALLETLKGS